MAAHTPELEESEQRSGELAKIIDSVPGRQILPPGIVKASESDELE